MRLARSSTFALAAALVSVVAASCGGRYGSGEIAPDASVDATTTSMDAAPDPTRTPPDGSAAELDASDAAADAEARDASDASDASDAGVSCPCYTAAQITALEASAGARLCVVDSMGGGTTQTALIKSQGNHRYVAEALQAASLPGSDLACSFGCLDDTPGDGIDDCVGLPVFAQTFDLSVAAHARCRELVAVRCP